jgi:hypothetical protein
VGDLPPEFHACGERRRFLRRAHDRVRAAAAVAAAAAPFEAAAAALPPPPPAAPTG